MPVGAQTRILKSSMMYGFLQVWDFFVVDLFSFDATIFPMYFYQWFSYSKDDSIRIKNPQKIASDTQIDTILRFYKFITKRIIAATEKKTTQTECQIGQHLGFFWNRNTQFWY